MTESAHRIVVRLFATLLFMNLLLVLPVAASDGSDNKNKESRPASPSAEAAQPASDPAEIPAQAAVAFKLPSISLVMFSDAMKIPSRVEIAPEAKAPVEVADPAEEKSLPFEIAGLPHANSSPSIPAPRASTAPMTAGEKLKLFATSALVPPGPYIQSIFTGLINELVDNNEGRDDTPGNYFGDVMTRAARSQGNKIANNFFEKFFYPTIFKQDPRYHRSEKRGAGARVGHAITRVFVTQGDRSGDQFNASFLIGGFTGAAVSTAWQREEKQTVGHGLRRWGAHIYLTMLTNILREFLSGQ
ncbi:MAG: hypothetical protein L0229_21285 [Blastocatellia bacterium]|nr:hypothetical protein [Blastocatellia bacterium]